MLKDFVLHLFLIILAGQLVTGCSTMRTEFYRGETKHLYHKGTESYKQGNYQEARSTFEKIVDLDPDYGPAHAALGNLAMIAEDYPSALTHYRTAIKYDPELKEEILPLLLTSIRHKARQPLVEQNIDLNKIHKLLLDEKLSILEELLQKDIPLQLLASDTISLTPGKLAELRRKTEDLAPTITGSVRLRLFLGHILFLSRINDPLTIELLKRTVKEAGKQEQQEIYLLLGRLHERTGKKNQAVNNYLAAVRNGLPMAEAAPFLARIYQVDIATVMPLKATKKEPVKIPEPVEITLPSISSTSSTSFSPQTNTEPENNSNRTQDSLQLKYR